MDEPFEATCEQTVALSLSASVEMNSTRHRLSTEPVMVGDPQNLIVDSAESLERAGNWYSAGEKYLEAAERMPECLAVEPSDRTKLFVRAATCFDVAGQGRAAARAYASAAAELERSASEFRSAGELLNRAALLFVSVGEYFSAGTCWRRAASSFANSAEAVLAELDNISPVPSAAGKFTVAANCYTAAGDAFLLANDNEMWSCGAYWEAGRAHSMQGHGYHAFVAYRKALTSVARFYGTHDREELRRILPLTEEEREANLDPVMLMEREAYSGNEAHQHRNSGMLTASWTRAETHRQLIAAYHEFYLAFAARGSTVEASTCRTAEKEHTRRLILNQQHYGTATLYWIWKITSAYGESLRRWALTCVAVLCGFAALYELGLIEPVHHWFDYFYFSVVTFTTLGYGDLHPTGIAGEVVACLEVIAGLVMFGLLLTFFVNRFQHS